MTPHQETSSPSQTLKGLLEMTWQPTILKWCSTCLVCVASGATKNQGHQPRVCCLGGHDLVEQPRSQRQVLWGGSCDITAENPTHIWHLPVFPTKLWATVWPKSKNCDLGSHQWSHGNSPYHLQPAGRPLNRIMPTLKAHLRLVLLILCSSGSNT